MREIKFRGKSEKFGWVYGYYEYRNGQHIIQPADDPQFFYVDPETVGQYTGEKDKNGEEIYEGDIFIKKTTFYKNIYVIEFRGGAWVLVNQKNNIGSIDLFAFLQDMETEIDIKLSGNIHDNPELLK